MVYKIILCLIVSMSSVSFSQENKLNCEEVLDLFIDIYKSDQSNFDDKKKRHQIMESNFNRIINLIENQGFVYVDKQYAKKKHRKIIENGLTITITHIFQINSELILNYSIIKLFRIELERKAFKKEYLSLPLSIFLYDHSDSLDEKSKLMLDIALGEWKISKSDLKFSN